jgi:hypothetical protein
VLIRLCSWGKEKWSDDKTYLKSQEANAEDDFSEIRLRYGPGHPRYLGSRSKFESASQAFRSRVQQLVTGLSDTYRQAQLDQINAIEADISASRLTAEAARNNLITSQTALTNVKANLNDITALTTAQSDAATAAALALGTANAAVAAQTLAAAELIAEQAAQAAQAVADIASAEAGQQEDDLADAETAVNAALAAANAAIQQAALDEAAATAAAAAQAVIDAELALNNLDEAIASASGGTTG